MAKPTITLVADNDDENESLLIHDIARLFKKQFDRRVRDLGLTRSQWLAIGTLRRNPGISQADLADKLDIEPMTVGRTLDRLEKAGWIERRADAADRRVKRLYLTPRVKDVVVRMRAQSMEIRGEVVTGLSKQDHQQLVRILHQMRNNLSDRTKAEP